MTNICRMPGPTPSTCMTRPSGCRFRSWPALRFRSPGTSPLTLPLGCKLSAALGLGYGGLDEYGFHAMEGLQCMVERRRGGETGVVSVQAVQGKGIQDALQEGRWSKELLDAAVATTPAPAGGRPKEISKNSTFFLLEYHDGLKAAVMETKLANQFAFAGQLKGEPKPEATWFELQDGKPYGHFAYLLRAMSR